MSTSTDIHSLLSFGIVHVQDVGAFPQIDKGKTKATTPCPPNFHFSGPYCGKGSWGHDRSYIVLDECVKLVRQQIIFIYKKTKVQILAAL